MSVRKFLKKAGVTSQREIETAVREAVELGRLNGDERPPVRVTAGATACEFATRWTARFIPNDTHTLMLTRSAIQYGVERLHLDPAPGQDDISSSPHS